MASDPQAPPGAHGAAPGQTPHRDGPCPWGCRPGPLSGLSRWRVGPVPGRLRARPAGRKGREGGGCCGQPAAAARWPAVRGQPGTRHDARHKVGLPGGGQRSGAGRPAGRWLPARQPPPFLDGWHVEQCALVSTGGLSSEVVIAARGGGGPADSPAHCHPVECSRASGNQSATDIAAHPPDRAGALRWLARGGSSGSRGSAVRS